jgi:hypothetical protein
VNYHCCDELRRNLVAADATLNGVDYLDVVDTELGPHHPLRQRTLLVHCLKPVPAGFSRDNVRIVGGERIRNVEIQWARPASPVPVELNGLTEAAVRAIVAALADAAAVLVVRVAAPGDFSTYALSLAKSATDGSPPDRFDPQLASIDFSFKVECPSDFDCRRDRFCPPAPQLEPDINYLAKDYGTFRRLLLDRMAQIAPQWSQSSVADYGVALVELIAYVGDQLSYQQDAVATEAYLGTARRRISLRRHAVLVDYPMHDGCNARAWVQLQIQNGAPSFVLSQAGTQFLTRCPGFAPLIDSASADLTQAMLLVPTVFEPLHAARLDPAHNKIAFYTWSDKRCCLPVGATTATLAGSLPNLKAGDPLLFEEVLGPQTGQPADADPRHRHVVRLTASATGTDPLTKNAITEIAWAAADAVPFALCISSVTDEAHGVTYQPDVSVARGNLVLVDHGRTVKGESLGQVPPPSLFAAPDRDAVHCAPQVPVPIPARYRPRLAGGPLTQAGTVLVQSTVGGQSTSTRQAFDPDAPAAEALTFAMNDVLPQITLTSTLLGQNRTWQSRRTLLNSPADATDFVAEVDDDDSTQLRFGDDTHAVRPATDTAFVATYRVGNGSAGNVGAGSIAHLVASGLGAGVVSGVRNPTPAAGGIDPEFADSVRRNAPEAFRTQERAVTPDDYAAMTERHKGVQRAAATLRWTGSWHTVFVTVDPQAGVDPGPLKSDLPSFVERYRMAGHDLEFNDPRYVSLELNMHVCAQPDYFRSDVKAGLLELFSNSILPDGRRGLFHPDNFTFGQTVFLSPLYAAAHAVPGVASVQITKFQRQGTADSSYLAKGELPLGRLEIARLDNDSNFPEHGVLRIDVNGGK